MRSPLAAYRKRASDDDCTVETIETATSSPSASPVEGFRKRLGDDESTVATSASSLSPRASPVLKRQVRFSLESNQIFPVVHIDEMDPADIFETWYEPRDYEAVKARLIPVIRRMMRGVAIEETNEQTIRGLEFRTRQGAAKRQETKENASVAVFDEQERQRATNEIDDESIAQVYHDHAAECQEKAHRLGKQDEEVIKEDLLLMRKQLALILPPPPPHPKSKSKGVSGFLKNVRIRKQRMVAA